MRHASIEAFHSSPTGTNRLKMLPGILCCSDALNQNAAIFSAFEAMNASRLVCRACVPGLGQLYGRELDNHNTFSGLPFKDFMWAISRQNLQLKWRKSGSNHLLVDR